MGGECIQSTENKTNWGTKVEKPYNLSPNQVVEVKYLVPGNRVPHKERGLVVECTRSRLTIVTIDPNTGQYCSPGEIHIDKGRIVRNGLLTFGSHPRLYGNR